MLSQPPPNLGLILDIISTKTSLQERFLRLDCPVQYNRQYNGNQDNRPQRLLCYRNPQIYESETEIHGIAGHFVRTGNHQRSCGTVRTNGRTKP
jgi:hypothetical protein